MHLHGWYRMQRLILVPSTSDKKPFAGWAEVSHNHHHQEVAARASMIHQEAKQRVHEVEVPKQVDVRLLRATDHHPLHYPGPVPQRLRGPQKSSLRMLFLARKSCEK